MRGEPPAGRELAVDTGLAMLVLVVVGTAITADVGHASAGPGMAAYAFGALLAVLMFARRRWPVATLLLTALTLIVYYGLSYPPIGLAAPAAAALYSAAEQGELRWSVATAGALFGISTTHRILEGDDLAYLLGFETGTTLGLMAAAIALGDGVRARRGWRAELARQSHAARLERERESARRVEQERLRIARDLHDLMAHTVSVISLHTDVARESLRDAPEVAERSLAAARSACSDVSRELRLTLGALRAGDPDDGPALGLDRLDGLVATAAAAGLDIDVRTSGRPVRLSAISDATAYRVVQESLSNVLRHADARRVRVDLDYGAGELLLRVSDDGRGAGTETGTDTGAGTGTGTGGGESRGWGLTGMRERLALLGGGLRTSSPAQGGFVVEASVPLEEHS
ncbi:sensor histidine kinase [Nonomuraea cavernae]|uniref:histidine kinase n=1 Tax=Nonomuraea cavernae TaxID=2045107 RepID=A0A918DEA4_9ACTN|nr:sensor histidine kinase [Nonomuraea cavernae]MCA2183601.1 sensor histidine kinase [Nonomuraea cavernae]GGO60793.1 two-component sensor histidine kinase [Nonomuraea cavernae]